MNKKVLSFAALAAISAAIFATPATAAPTTSSWGYWSDGGTISFDDATGLIGADYEVKAEGLEWLNSDSEGEFFVSDTPVGKYFGASPTTGILSKTNFIKVETSTDTVTDAQVIIRFDQEVPANRVALVISDIDFDRAIVSMKNAAGDDISAANIKGKTPTTAFNFCTYTPVAGACGGDTDKPTVTASGTSVTAKGNLQSSDGSTFWVVPSAAVKTITILIRNFDETSMTSTQRIWLAQSSVDIELPDAPKLADTGSESSPVLWMASLGLLLAGAAARRFATKK